jgi:hypothetical protein
MSSQEQAGNEVGVAAIPINAEIIFAWLCISMRHATDVTDKN